MQTLTPEVRQETAIPEVMRAHAPPFDYFDVFTITATAGADTSPERWARVAVEDVAGAAGQFVWRGILRLRLADRPDRVGGWKIADRGNRWLRLEAQSRVLTAHVVVHVGDERLTVGTFVRYDRPIARLVWPRLAVVHRAAMPRLLRGTVRMMSRSR